MRNAIGSGVRSSMAGSVAREAPYTAADAPPPPCRAQDRRGRLRPVNAEFNWWLLIVGLVIGAGLVYLVLADSSRRDADVLAEELPREATWISMAMREEGRPIDPPTAERVL